MIKLIFITLIACAFFSTTYIFNELMSDAGGHWYWSASLRYLFMFILLTIIIGFQDGWQRIKALWHIYISHWRFWTLTGSIGFGIFYAALCYAGDHVSGWVVAATFMFTVVASLFVLMAFGHRFDRRFIVYAGIIFIGVVMANISEAIAGANESLVIDIPLLDIIIYGTLPSLLAAFSYPIGSQLVWQASYNARVYNVQQAKQQQTLKNLTFWTVNNEFQPLTTLAPRIVSLKMGDYFQQQSENVAITQLPKSKLQQLIELIPTIPTTLLRSSFNKVWLMTVGSIPFWIALGIAVRPEAPMQSQVHNTFLVALLSGVIATSLYLYAREQAQTPSEVAGVDATQASEIIFALLGGILLLNNPLPSMLGIGGIVLVLTGLMLFAKNG
ncbi:multidrug resistance efflux transporter family protein [Psychrobacter lutiphocae]|nr:multidrug resistance efflux transporter family protein [Psychrobacter lutiphocae]